jgi:SAM-dependent methyltransferase
MSMNQPLPSSYRDPSGFVFRENGRIRRQINSIYAADYELLKSSGLYKSLTEKKLLVMHEEIAHSENGDGVYKIIQPTEVRSVSYPYEWSFSQLKDAALLTLRIQREAMAHGMSLKDATPFNVMFDASRPIFVDTASFERYNWNRPWVAYHQFCTCFLAPLLLASYQGPEMIKLLQLYPEGIPIDLAARLLPGRSRFSPLALLNIHLQNSVSSRSNGEQGKPFTAQKFERIIDHLHGGINSLQLNKKVSTWSHYYEETILSEQYLKIKEELVAAMIERIPCTTVLDLGCNTGQFSILMAKKGKRVIATDFDPLCIERLYLYNKEKQYDISLAVTDLMNPTPAIGFDNKERVSFTARARSELILALALIHHLCIVFNLPFNKLAEFMASLGKYLLIEFVPKDDEKVQQLLRNREDIFTHYDVEGFRNIFCEHFEILAEKAVPGSNRKLFLMMKKQ